MHKKKLWILYKIHLALFGPLGYIIVTKDEGPRKKISRERSKATAGKGNIGQKLTHFLR